MSKSPSTSRFAAAYSQRYGDIDAWSYDVSQLFSFSFDGIAISALTCMVLFEILKVALPNKITGPGSSLIDTDPS